MTALLLLFGLACEASTQADTWRIDTVAGNGQAGDLAGESSEARSIPVDQPFGVEQGPGGTWYITSVGQHRVLKLDASGVLTSVAGNGTRGYSGDGGAATSAQLNEPYEVRFDAQGNMYFVEMMNHLVRRVDAASGVITTIAGDGNEGFAGDGGPASRTRRQRKRDADSRLRRASAGGRGGVVRGQQRHDHAILGNAPLDP